MNERAPSTIVHMSISGAPPAAQAVADTVGRSFRLTDVPGRVAAGDYAAPSGERTRWQIDTSAPVTEAATPPATRADARADAYAGSVRVELGGQPEAVVKVAALIRERFRAGPPTGFSRAFEVWPADQPDAGNGA